MCPRHGVSVVRAPADLCVRALPFLEQIEEAIARGSSRIALDVSAVDLVNPLALGCLAKALLRARESGGGV